MNVNSGNLQLKLNSEVEILENWAWVSKYEEIIRINK